MVSGLAACGGGGSGGGGGGADTIKIGMLQPMSGSAAGYGEETEAGFKFVVDQINAAGGIKSRGGAKLELEVADTASQPGQAATEARRLMGKDGASMIVGTLLTNEMAAVAPVADQYQVPTLAMFAAGSSSDYIYSIGSPYDEGYAGTMVDFIDYLNKKLHAGLKTAVLASSNYEAGQAVDKALEPRLAAAGLDVVGKVPLDQDTNDYGPAVAKIGSYHADVVTGVAIQKDGIQLHEARAKAGMKTLFVGSASGYADAGVFKNLGADAQNVLVNNTFGMTTFAASAEQAATKKLLADAKTAGIDVPLGQNFVSGAQAARIVQHALEGAKSTSSADLIEALKKIDIPAGSDDLYLLKADGLRFDKNRFPTDVQNLMIQWNADGTQDVVWPEKFASRAPRLP
ncbi:MAG: Extracellular ligand-binding receptor [Frankiales bacterium]|nr:Extracellular ligand-binding receptor [Frankiales bacterium]